jgi:lipoate-protein ligase A
MKLSVIAYKSENESVPDFPVQIKRTRDLILNFSAKMMHLHGVQRINLNIKSVGPLMVSSPTMVLLDDAEVPPQLVAVRNQIVKNVAATLETYGILDFEIEPTDKERKNMRSRWSWILRGDEEEGTL